MKKKLRSFSRVYLPLGPLQPNLTSDPNIPSTTARPHAHAPLFPPISSNTDEPHQLTPNHLPLPTDQGRLRRQCRAPYFNVSARFNPGGPAARGARKRQLQSSSHQNTTNRRKSTTSTSSRGIPHPPSILPPPALSREQPHPTLICWRG